MVHIGYLLLTLVSLLILDYLYLGVFGASEKLYIPIHRRIQKSKIKTRTYSVILSYLLSAFGIYYFVVKKYENSNIVIEKIIKRGVLFGFVVNGIYNFTNHSLFEDYTLRLSIQDTVWGAIVTPLTALSSLYLMDLIETN